MRKALWIILPIAFILAACEPDTGCRDSMATGMGVSVIRQLVDSVSTQRIDQWDSVLIQGVGADSVLYTYKQSAGKKTLNLPLRPNNTITAYQFQWHGETDTLYIQHTPLEHFVSLACGCAIYHTIDTVWAFGSLIQKAEVINSAVERGERENVRLTLIPESKNK